MQYEEWIEYKAPSNMFTVRFCVELDTGEAWFGIKVFRHVDAALKFKQEIDNDPRRCPQNRDDAEAYFLELSEVKDDTIHDDTVGQAPRE